MQLKWGRPALGLRSEEAERSRAAYLALDIGTEFLKVVAVKPTASGPVIVGSWRERQEYGDMDGGAVCSIDGVSATASRALAELRRGCGLPLTQGIVGIAGAFVKGIVTRVEQERWAPARPLQWGEFRKLVVQAQTRARAEARERIAAEVRLPAVEVELVNSAVVEARIDGQRVTNPLNFQGRHLELTVFNTFAPLTHIGALRSVARNVDVSLMATVAEPYAVASAALTDDACEFGAVVLDVGGGTTDMALIGNGGIAGTAMMAMGGRAFTRSLAQLEGLTLREAEERKLEYAFSRLSEEEMSAVKRHLQSDLEIWQHGVRLLWREIESGGGSSSVMPSRVALCGGGSALPGLAEAVRQLVSGDGGAEAQGQVAPLRAEDLREPADPGHVLSGSQDVTPKGLALLASRLGQRSQNDSISTVGASAWA